MITAISVTDIGLLCQVHTIFIGHYQPIRYFIISLMYNNSGYPIPLVALNSIIMVTRFLNLLCNVCFVVPVYLQIVYKGLNA